MFGRKPKEYRIRRKWELFDRESYHWAWHDEKVKGFLKRFGRDIKCCRQRISRGYCDDDLFSIYDWFFAVVPDMLEQYKNHRRGSPGVLGENYTNEKGILVNDTCHAEWDEILTEMIRLFHEADEITCQKKNSHEEEFHRIYDEFSEKYGHFGEKLQTEEERKENAKSGSITWYSPKELPEYQEAMEQYDAEEAELKKYREQCKDEAFALFAKWFYHLWD